MTSMSTSEDAPKTRCPWCKGDCLRWGLETCPFRPRQLPRPRKDGEVEELWRAPLVPKYTCIACRCDLPTERTTVRRADGTVRFSMCNACFDRRFCTTCLVYFSSAQGRQVHQCPN